MKRIIQAGTACALLLTCNISLATEGFVPPTSEGGAVIQGIISDSLDFGGCMVQMPSGKRPHDAGFACPTDGWVTIDCKAQHPDTESKADATSVFSSAQLAFVTEAPIRLVVDDTKKINGYCVARRVVIL